MLQFEDYKKNRDAEQAEAERAYEEELRNKPINELTPQEIGYLYDLNESFVGEDADPKKMRLYAALKDSITAFMSDCDEAHKLTEVSPNQKERHAILCMDIKPVATLDKREAKLLADIIAKADRVVVSTDDSRIRFSFAVENIWKKRKRG